jgi:hypothetical protein
MDIFHEQIVKKPNTPLRIAARVGIAFGAALLAAIVLFLLMTFFPMAVLIAGALVYLGWYLASSFNVEYEYILTNDDFDIDKIIAKRKRKRLVSMKVSSFSDFFPYTAETAQAGNRTLVSCAGTGYQTYAADFKHDRLGECRLVFSPSDEMLAELVKVFPRALRAKANQLLSDKD